MIRKQKTPEELQNDPIKRMHEVRKERKMVQETNWKNYIKAKEDLKNEIDENEGTDIQEQMMKERRDFITEERKINQGKVPKDNDKLMEKFYERFNVEAALSPEEEEAKKAAEEAEAAAKKKGKKKDAGGAKKGKKGKGKKDEGETKEVAKISTTEVIRKFDD